MLGGVVGLGAPSSPPFGHSSHGLLPSDRATGTIGQRTVRSLPTEKKGAVLAGRRARTAGSAGYWIPDQVRDDRGWVGLVTVVYPPCVASTGVIPGEDPGTSMLGGVVGLGAPLIPCHSSIALMAFSPPIVPPARSAKGRFEVSYRGRRGLFWQADGQESGCCRLRPPDQVRDDRGRGGGSAECWGWWAG